jgi:O-antigen ligase
MKAELDAVRLSLCVVIAIGVCRIHQHYGWMAVFRPGLTLVAIALGAALMNPRALAPASWRKAWTTKVVVGITICTFGSIAFGISQGGAFYYFEENYSKVLVVGFLLMAAMRTPKSLYAFIWAYVIGCGILVWMALFMFGLHVEQNGMARLSSLYTWDANDIGVLLLMGLPLALLVFKTSQTTGKVASGAIIIGIGSAIARSGSRGAFIGLITVMLAYVVGLRGASLAGRTLPVLAISIGLAVAAPPGYWEQMKTIMSAQDDYNYTDEAGRKELAKRGMQYMLQYPVFGVGLMQFGRAEGTISERAKNWDPSQPGIWWAVPHNSYVAAGAELGIPGFVLFIVLVVGCVVGPWRLRKRVPLGWAGGTAEQRFLFQTSSYLPLAAIGFAVSSFFVTFTYNDPVYLLAAMVGAFPRFVDEELAKEARGYAPSAPPRGLGGRVRRVVSHRAGRPLPPKPADSR